ncbi:MAG: translation initiation factor IF-2 [Magnetococcales bacterium]|nr:translation initiation factor IF-2 [Magnetococcales bacterium]
MSDDTKNSDKDNKLHLKAPRRIVLKKTVEGGSIKQNFSHGRSKSVVVEVRRKRTFVKAGEGKSSNETLRKSSASPQDQGPADDSRTSPDDPQKNFPQGHHILPAMSPEERKAYEETQRQERRERIEADSKARGEVEVETGPQDEEQVAVGVTPPVGEPPAIGEIASLEPAPPEPPPVEPADVPSVGEPPAGEEPGPAPPALEEEISLGTESAPVAEPELVRVVQSQAQPGKAAGPLAQDLAKPKKPLSEAEAGGLVDPAAARKGGDPKRKLSRQQREEVARQKTEDLVAKRLAQLEEMREQKRLIEERRSLQVEEGAVVAPRRETLKTKVKRKGRKGAGVPQGGQGAGPVRRGRGGAKDEIRVDTPLAPVVREVVIPETITVGELANRMAVKASKVIKLLFGQGMMVTINQALDLDTAALVVEEMGHKAKMVSESANIQAELADAEDAPETMQDRWPVVTVMGHVDHGKTSLLDAIRNTHVAAGEHGGITQHIGAYQVTLEGDRKITFLDTPGHAAFTAMRARGAKVTDLVVLVVAADDGVMPQTREAISHAKDAGVPILVAVNKIDLPSASPERVMQQLAEFGLIPEEWGGETVFVRVSAKTGEGLKTLEEMIVLQGEVLGLKANPLKRARGVIVEANLDKGRGAVATCLVQSGTLRVGDIFVAGSEWGKIRLLLTDQGESIQEAGPSTPVELIGLSGIPRAGDEIVVVPDERRAREIASYRVQKAREAEQAKQTPAKLDDLFDQIKQGEKVELKVVIKGDVQGSVEAVSDALAKIEHEKVQTNVIHSGVGGINESDVMLAVASRGIAVGFNVRADAKARELAKREKVELRFYNVIYDLVDDVTKAMEGLLKPTIQETVVAHAQVQELFRISKVGTVAGCKVLDGVVQRGGLARLLRDHVVVHEGTISALKRFKEDAKEVREGLECGICLDKFGDIKTGDVIEVFIREEVRSTIAR